MTIWIILGIYVFLNSYVTFLVIKSDYLERVQKVAQSIIVWLLPFLGAILIWIFITNDDKPNKPRNPNDGQGQDSIVGGAQ